MGADVLLEAVGRTLTGPCGVQAGSRLLVACSGGLDSTVLLDLLARLRDGLSLELFAATVEHGLRPDAGEEAEAVHRMCAAAAIPWARLPVQISDDGRRRHGLEAAAREERHRALAAEALRIGSPTVALAHHLDDQAETVLMRALVGTGIRGLAAMRPRAGGRVRPMLFTPRAQILAYAQERGLAWSEDPSNGDSRFLRNRMRHKLMPMIRQLVDPSSASHLAALADRCAVDDRYLTELADAATGLGSGDAPEVPVARVAQLDRALQVRVVLGLLRRLDARSTPGNVHLDAALALLEGSNRSAGVDLPGGLRIERNGERLRAMRSGPNVPAPSQEKVLGIPGHLRWPGTGHVIRAELHCGAVRIGEGSDAGKWRAWFDHDQLTTPVRVHTFETGCRMRPFGGPGSRKISDLMSEARISREQRASWPIISDAEQVLWVPGCRSSDAARVDSGTERILELKVEDNR